MSTALELRSVRKAFRGKPALRAADLCVETGTIHGFVGPNGAGKTTCLRLLVGLLQRDDGDLAVFGLDPRTHALAIRRRCAYLPGETSLYPYLTGGEFLDFALSFYPSHDAGTRRAMQAAWPLPLERKVRTYSAGMKQKLALLATLVPDVELYVLDEPDRALDATARLFLRDRLRELQARGKTILLSSHHLADVEALASKLTFLMDGSTVPAARVETARARLREELRIRVRQDTVLPDGTCEVVPDHDGTLRIKTAGDPLAWVQRVDREALLSVEMGVTRLEDLYQMLTAEAEAPGQ